MTKAECQICHLKVVYNGGTTSMNRNDTTNPVWPCVLEQNTNCYPKNTFKSLDICQVTKPKLWNPKGGIQDRPRSNIPFIDAREMPLLLRIAFTALLVTL